MYVYVYIYIYIYIHIIYVGMVLSGRRRARRAETLRDVRAPGIDLGYVCMYVCVCVCIYVYIYIYIYMLHVCVYVCVRPRFLSAPLRTRTSRSSSPTSPRSDQPRCDAQLFLQFLASQCYFGAQRVLTSLIWDKPWAFR